MTTNRLEALEIMRDELQGYNIATRDDFDQALIEICDGMIDFATYDLIESIHFLYGNEYLEYIDGDLMEAIFGAQYEYYREIAFEHEDELWASVKVDEDEEDEE
jgi:hypothetical protein